MHGKPEAIGELGDILFSKLMNFSKNVTLYCLERGYSKPKLHYRVCFIKSYESIACNMLEFY